MGSYAVASFGGAPSATEQVTVTSSTGTGDAVVVCVGAGSAGVVSSVTDSQGNTYTLQQSETARSMGLYAYLGFTNTPLASGTDWIKVTYATSSTGQQWIARGMAGVSGVDINTTADGSSATLALTSASPVQAAEWAITLAATAGAAPSGWTGGFTAQKTVQNGAGAYYTFADQITTSTNPLQPSATIPSNRWELITLSLKLIPIFSIGQANSTGTGSSLTIPVTTPTQPGNAIVVFAKQNGATVTSVTDSTGGNSYSVQQTNTGNSYDVTTITAGGITEVGAAYSSASYSGAGSRLTAAQELDTWLNGGGANWPTHKLSPRTMAFNGLREYYNTDPLMSAASTGWPTSSGADTRGMATALADGIQNVFITFRPARDGTNNYTSGTYTTEKANLASAISYIKGLFPKAKFCLWHEANIFGTSGPFGSATQDPSLGSPYGSSVSVSQMHANWAAYVGFYGPAFQSAGADLYWVTSYSSPGEAIDFFDIALNNTQRGYFTGIAHDCYVSDFVNAGAATAKKTLTQGYGTNNLSALGLAAKYGLPVSIWELGAGTSHSASDNTFFLDTLITAPLVTWMGGGNPVAEILWFNYGGDVIGSAMAPAVLSSVQAMYDALQGGGQGTTTALSTGDTITVNWSSGANTKFATAVGIVPVTTGLPDQMATGSGSSTAPSATTGALSQSNEIALAYSTAGNASGQITWGAGWTVLATDHTGTSTFQSVAYQALSSTSAVTASGTLGVSGTWDVNLITFPVTSVALTSGMVVPKPKISGTGLVSSTPLTGTGAMQVPKPKIASGGVSVPGAPYVIGSAGANSTSISISVATSVSAGDTIQVGVTLDGTVQTPVVGPDSAGNVYSLIATDIGNSAVQLYVFESDGANALTSGVDTIPVTQATAIPMEALAVGDNGVFAGDKVNITHGTSTSPASPSTGTLSQAEEHAIAWIANAEAGGVPAWASPWSSHVLSTIDTGAVTKLSAAYQIVNATTALTASATIASAAWAAAITTTEVSPPAITLVPSNGVAGVPYEQTLEATGQAPFTYSVSSGSLPTGLTLSGAVISGVPSTAGTYDFTLQVADGNGVTATLAVVVEILFGATGAAAMTQIPNNLFSADDSDFETQNFSWGAAGNAAAPFPTQGVAFTGEWSLGWASLTDGATSITSQAIPVTPGSPCILSGVLLPAQAVGAEVGIAWLDQNSNPLDTDLAPTVAVNPGSWNPLTGMFTAPAGAFMAQPLVNVEDSNAGDTNFIDMMFFAGSDSQVQVDWINPPFGANASAGNSFMDVSPWVRLDGNGVTYTRGRQDAISTIQPGTGSFDLKNDAGEFTRDSATSLPAAMGGAVTLSCRVQLNKADQNGVWYTRFDGRIAEVDYDVDPTGYTSSATIALTDVLSYLGQQDPLFCWAKQQALADGPLYHWSLDDAGTTSLASTSGAGVAVESSGNNGPPLRLTLSDTHSPPLATVTWQDTSGGVETLADAASATGQDGSSFWTAGSNQPNSRLRGLVSGNVGPFTAPIGSVLLTPNQVAQSAQNTFIGGMGYMLTGALPAPIAPTATGSDYSIELWMMPDTSLVSGLAADKGPYIALALGSGTTKTNLLAGIFLNSGTATIKCSNYTQPPAFLGLNWSGQPAPTPINTTSSAFTPDTAKSPHHLVITIAGDQFAPQLHFYLDGTEVGSGIGLPTGQTYDTICVGGAYGGCGAFNGNLSLLSVYPYVLSQGQVTQHCQMGQYGMWEATTDDCVAQISQYAGIPGYWSDLVAQHAGLTMTDYFDITGSNALSAMQQYELAERGLLFVNSQGSLDFHTRSWRMGYGAPDLLLPPGTFSEQLEYKVLSQFMVNEEGISGPNTLGATATSLLANPSTGQTSIQTSTSSVIQAGYTNADSMAKYGTYTSSPVSAPLSLPLVAWSRGFAALGLPSYSYWTDPGLDDRAAWDANSRSEPWAFPAQLTIDLLTLDPDDGLAISDFYGLDIDNMLAPTADTLPPSFPDAQTSVEWFIEGVTETWTVNSHTIEFFTSPAEPQRAWVPGDATYGVLGSTTRLGISAADTNTPQAYGKSVSHDAGGPYWPPSFGLNLNAAPAPPSPPGYVAPQPVGGFVGAADLRGIAANLQAKLKPPMCVVGTENQVQSFNSGALSGTSPPAVSSLYWDQVFVDTAGGMGAVPGWPNWYLVTTAGYYEIDASVVWASTSSQSGYTGQSWIIVAQSAAQAIAAGTGNPLTVNQYVRPIGEAADLNSVSMNPVCAPTTRMYLGVGDMVCIGAEQNYSGQLNTGTGFGGSRMSLRFVGFAANDDRTLINTSLASGGSVSLISKGTLQQATFFNTHTYSYRGKNTTNGQTPYSRIDTDNHCWQGVDPSQQQGGSRASQMAFNYNNINSTLTGHTILSAKLTGSNVSCAQNSVVALIGWTSNTPGGNTWNPSNSSSHVNIMTQRFVSGQTLTFNIPVSIIKAFINSSAKALTLGNGVWSNGQYFGLWKSGPSSWELTVNYV